MFSNMTRFHCDFRREIRYQVNGRFTKCQPFARKSYMDRKSRQNLLLPIKKQGRSPVFSLSDNKVVLIRTGRSQPVQPGRHDR
nr:hypothetical protein [Cronobacter muytjensii]